MSHELISRREDLKRLIEEGYEIEVRSGHLVLHRVPYVRIPAIVNADSRAS